LAIALLLRGATRLLAGPAEVVYLALLLLDIILNPVMEPSDFAILYKYIGIYIGYI
jgi:hypothetical protein